ncbi:hypothetical protein [Streptomyces sp. H39-C1]|uniref:hypothetical protein n=1 Tax=Streptomyces sp. H39-C1 TaxID=3004355 RepID=UPI0022AFC805|nr:hypothetical protein [Streptomyces sp. H39-C1]MCZ4100467.1 hypothetical protein [Streptomyces sp. H39-C1]
MIGIGLVLIGLGAFGQSPLDAASGWASLSAVLLLVKTPAARPVVPAPAGEGAAYGTESGSLPAPASAVERR